VAESARVVVGRAAEDGIVDGFLLFVSPLGRFAKAAFSCT
jgi:hypothetical protein